MTMTLAELREMVAKEPATNDRLEIKVWLPGSRISLEPTFLQIREGLLLIEGNLDTGSLLRVD